MRDQVPLSPAIVFAAILLAATPGMAQSLCGAICPDTFPAVSGSTATVIMGTCQSGDVVHESGSYLYCAAPSSCPIGYTSVCARDLRPPQ
jgi:ferredoxin